MDNRMLHYIAPRGYVYDFKDVPVDNIKEPDGSVTQVENHLYASQLVIGQFDELERYVLIPDPRKEEGNA